MRRLVLFLVLCVFTVTAFGQTKKILLESDEATLLKELQSASPKAKIVPVNSKNVMLPQLQERLLLSEFLLEFACGHPPVLG